MTMGRALIVLGLVLVLFGLLVTYGGRVPLRKLPGDIVWRGKNTTLYFPLMTSILLSILLSLVLWLFSRR